MTQVLMNTINNLQDMMSSGSKASSSNFVKDFEVKKSQSDVDIKTVEEISGMDRKTLDETTDFDKVFNKQLQKENSSKTEEVKSEGDSDDTSFNSLENIRVNDYKNDWSSSIVELREFISQMTEEANTENSLDLTLARDINEIINQLNDVSEEKSETIETTTDDTCVAVLDELLSNLEDEIDNSENVETENQDVNSESIDNNIIYEQLMNYVNKVDLQKNDKKEDVDKEIDLELDIETENVDIEISNEVLDLSTDILTNDTNIKTNVKSQLDEIEVPLEEDCLKELNIESIKAESQTSDNESSFMEHQTPEEHSVKAILNQDLESFDINITKTVESQNVQPQAKPVEVTPSKIIEQITKQMEGLQNSSKVNIVLNPESLGKVTIQLLKTGEGLSAQFTVASQEVKDMLMKGLDGLKDSLLTQGVAVENVTVKLTETEESSYNPDWTEQEGSRGGNKEQGRSNKDEKQKNIFEQMMAQTDEENGNV